MGSLLFLIMINDIDKKIRESILSIFMDDTKLTKIINEDEDLELFKKKLRNCIIKMQWAVDNTMAFNGYKC